MRKTKSWKHNTKETKQYGKRNTERYDTPFMMLDEQDAEREEEVQDV